MLLFVALFVLWVILNGRLTLEIGLFGLAISAVLTWFSRKFLRDDKGEKRKKGLRFYLLLAAYMLVLLWEVLKANTQVFRICLARRLSFRPMLVYFEPGLKLESSRVLLANSITLTPGTITVQSKEGRFCVHCLDRSLGEGLENCRFVRILKRMEDL